MSAGSKFLGFLGGMFALVAIFAFMCVTIVPPQTIGIPVTFGKPAAAVGNGLEVRAPWTKIVKMDASIQNDIYDGDRQVAVRLGNNAQAGVNASIQWRMKQENAQQLFLDYREFENIRSNLVNRNFVSAMNEVFSEFDPLTSVKENENNGGAGTDLGVFAEEVAAKMEERVGEDIEIISVTIPIVNFDDSTQAKIDELQAEIARTRVAEQKKSTAQAEKEANEVLEQSISDNLLTSKCLDIVEKSGQSPLGCFPNSAGQPILSN